MAEMIATGASAVCSFGTAPGTINATSQAACLVEGKPAATIQDAQPANITPFGMCTSLLNPQVAAVDEITDPADAAAMGVLTPQPCMLVPAGTWTPMKPGVLLGGQPCLTRDSTLMCSNGGGMISITVPGQMKAVIS